jgi:hypothetical protein
MYIRSSSNPSGQNKQPRSDKRDTIPLCVSIYITIITFSVTTKSISVRTRFTSSLAASKADRREHRLRPKVLKHTKSRFHNFSPITKLSSSEFLLRKPCYSFVFDAQVLRRRTRDRSGVEWPKLLVWPV